MQAICRGSVKPGSVTSSRRLTKALAATEHFLQSIVFPDTTLLQKIPCDNKILRHASTLKSRFQVKVTGNYEGNSVYAQILAVGASLAARLPEYRVTRIKTGTPGKAGFCFSQFVPHGSVIAPPATLLRQLGRCRFVRQQKSRADREMNPDLHGPGVLHVACRVQRLFYTISARIFFLSSLPTEVRGSSSTKMTRSGMP